MISPIEKSAEAALRQIEIFSDLAEEQLHWFASNCEEVKLAPGDALLHEGDPAEYLFVILQGALRGRRESASDTPIFEIRTGQVTGLLPFSRMTVVPVTVRALEAVWILRLHKDRFTEMLQRIPELAPRLVGLMTDRVRAYSQAEQQRDKMSALGKLSAGLAHELNNPASAAGRAAEGLREYMRDLRRMNKALDNESLSCQERTLLASIEEKLLDRLGSVAPMDALEQSDREEEVAQWLRKHNIANAARLASGLVEAGMDCTGLERLGAKFRDEVLAIVLARMVSAIGAERLTREIEASTGRIAELVKAIKEYTYMDQAPEQEVDIHRGIESTLTMLKFRLKRGVEVKREFDQSLPRVTAHGSDLNQVWTNLIDNAIDAMGGKGELTIRTSRELECVVVEIIDNGSGIAEDVQPHIFEPFFTTKGVGGGTGMGLDTVYRIVRAHRGEVSFDSRPGRTRFIVRLPISR